MLAVTMRVRPRAMAVWLIAVAALVVAMVVVGGITRLTESGLSITQWKPITGIIPPLNDAQWQAEFANYRRIPEYAAFNRGMTLAGFQAIYFWEYLHRALARVVGLAFAVPLVWFAAKRQIPQGYGVRLVALLALGALQGAVGWWMVKSGLSVRTDVSHIRLAVHLMTALFTLAGLIWTALDLLALAGRGLAPAALRPVVALPLAVLAVQLVLGAFTAGLDAGYAYASWPLMGDAWFPADGWQTGLSVAQNAADNPIVVQFLHRWTAFVAAAALAWLAVMARRSGGGRSAAALIALLVVQIGLGIATLLSGVEIGVAVAHQANAALLVIAATTAAHAAVSANEPPRIDGRVAEYPSANRRFA